MVSLRYQEVGGAAMDIKKIRASMGYGGAHPPTPLNSLVRLGLTAGYFQNPRIFYICRDCLVLYHLLGLSSPLYVSGRLLMSRIFST